MTSFKQAHKKIETAVTGCYKRIEDGVVTGYKKVEDKFIDAFLAEDGESTSEAKARLQEHTANTNKQNRRINK